MADPRINLEYVIETAIASALKELHTALPAKVTKVDLSTQTIECQPTIKRKISGEVVNLPLLVDVPLRYFKVSDFSITFPIAVDDYVLVIFSERSIDTWLASGDIQDPKDIRRHSLSDGFAIPIMYPQNDVISSFDTANLQIRTSDGANYITLTSSGDIYLNGSSDNAIAYTDMKTAFDQLKQDLNTFITLFNSHTHGGVAGGSGSTATPSASASSSSADMSGAKVDTVKVP